jgi:transposase
MVATVWAVRRAGPVSRYAVGPALSPCAPVGDPVLTGVTHIGVDEISWKKGHVYVTNVYDQARKRLLWSGEGRSQATVEAFFDFLGQRTAALEGFCYDMWQPFIDVVKVRASQAVLVFEKFHIVSHLMKAVDQARRRRVPKERPGGQRADAQDSIHLAEEPVESHRDAAPTPGRTRAPQPADQPGLSPQVFAHFWSYRRAEWAKRHLTRWFWWATHSRLSPLLGFAWMLRRHEPAILNYCRMPIDNGTVEGVNNKTKLIIHKAYGLRTAPQIVHTLGLD